MNYDHDNFSNKVAELILTITKQTVPTIRLEQRVETLAKETSSQAARRNSQASAEIKETSTSDDELISPVR